ncbi:hypothetical protein HOL24_09385 [bacterium]|jgi:spore coat polysaccharide biosynthesis protein SpsF|nr:hypothetical protein [bacterium]
MKFGVIIAARLGSSRLPGKALMPLLGMEILRLVIRRLKTSKYCHHFILATTCNLEDNKLVKVAKEEGIRVYRGDQENVLKRFVCAAESILSEDIKYIVRVTADCPLVGGDTLDLILKKCLTLGKFDLVSTKPAFHHGLDYEVYKRSTLKKIESHGDVTNEEKEHILNYIYNRENKYRVKRILPPNYLKNKGRPFLLDDKKDYDFFQKLLNNTSNYDISAKELLKLV